MKKMKKSGQCNCSSCYGSILAGRLRRIGRFIHHGSRD